MIFEFDGFEWPSKCDIEVIDSYIVIASQIVDGTAGTSISSITEGLAKQVCDRFRIPYDRLVWIEHYPNRSGDDSKASDESFTLVEFDIINGTLRNPRRHRIPCNAIRIMYDMMGKNNSHLF